MKLRGSKSGQRRVKPRDEASNGEKNMRNKMDTEQQARAQIAILQDTIDARRLEELSGIGPILANALIRTLSRAESDPAKIMTIAAGRKSIYAMFLDELNEKESVVFQNLPKSSWEHVLFHAQVCQRLLDENK